MTIPMPYPSSDVRPRDVTGERLPMRCARGRSISSRRQVHQPLTRREIVVYSAIGTAAWTTVLTALGFVLEGQYERVVGRVEPLANAVVAAIVATYPFRVATFDRGGRAAARRQRRVT